MSTQAEHNAKHPGKRCYRCPEEIAWRESLGQPTPRFWWLRPLRALVVGVSAGLGLSWLVAGAPGLDSNWVLVPFLAAMIGFCVWQLVDLRRMQRQHEASMERWRQALEGVTDDS